MKKKIVIIGAGLSGLLVAYRLKEKGFDIEIIEARARIGGRIHTINSKSVNVEMGATWFNDVHINLKRILNEFNLDYFEQFMKGTSYFESFSQAPVQEINIPQNSPSYRIVGGTSSLVQAIEGRLDNVKIYLNEVVEEIDFTSERIHIKTTNNSFNSDYIISTIPPALFINEVKCFPNLPEDLIHIATETHTWMQDSIKVALVYKAPFWREKGISGTVFSNVGPITEFYDQSNHGLNKFSLCGFVNSGMAMYSKEERLNKILIQLKKVFGDEVLNFIDYQEVIWSNEEFTKSKKQETFIFPHLNNGHPIFLEAFFNAKLFISGTETAQSFSGYMDGAVTAAESVVKRILDSKN